MKKSTIDYRVGLYSSEITMRDYGDRITVTVPYIKWGKSLTTGSLAFTKSTTTRNLPVIREFFDKGEIYSSGLSLFDLIGPH